MLYTYNHHNYIEAISDEELLEATIQMAKDEAAKGWRLSTVQWAGPGHTEYAHVFSDASPDGFENWGDEPWDERLWGVLIVDDAGSRSYNWDWKSKNFIPDVDNDDALEPIDEEQ